MYYMDWTMLLLIPGVLLAMFAQFRVKSAFEKGSKVRSRSGVTSTQVVSQMLRKHIPYNVNIQPVQGMLSDHYNPSTKSLALSADVYNNSSLAAIGVAAHEAGHAIQDAENYGPLRMRSAIVPAVQISSNLSPFIIMAGFLFNFSFLINIGILFFAATVVFTLITLPVEFDATRRAKQLLVSDGHLAPDELKVVSSVLDAAALTYVAASVNAILQLLRLLLISRRRND